MIPEDSRNVGLGLKTPDQVTAEMEAAKAPPVEDDTGRDPILISLAGHVRDAFSAAKRSKSSGTNSIDGRLLACDRARAGKYSPSFQRTLETQGGSDIFMMLADEKCRSLEAWLKDAMLPTGERPFHLDPTPIPELPPDVTEGISDGVMRFFQEGVQNRTINIGDVQELGPKWKEKLKAELLQELKVQSKQSADELTVEVNDTLTEGGWYSALSDIIEDIATYPAAFMEGPIVRKKRVLKWFQTAEGAYTPIPTEEIVREYERFSAYDAFPSPGAKSVQDGSFIRMLHYTRSDLRRMIGVEGYNEQAIRMVLIEYPNGLKEHLPTEQEQADLQDRPNERADIDGKIDCIKFWGDIQGKKLVQWGMSPEEVPDLEDEYSAIVYLIGRHVISARLNSHPLRKRGVFSAAFKHKNDSIWGQSPPEIMEDDAKICNACARSIVDNMGQSSGPQTWVIVDRMPPGELLTEGYPGKLWKFTSDKVQGRTDLPMGFFQPDSVVEPLLKLFDYFSNHASKTTGIPDYIQGEPHTGGAMSTASGLSMVMNSNSKSLRNVALNIDSGIIRPSVKEQWLHMMIFEPQKAKGDIKVVARASDYMVQMEMLQMRRNELLNTINSSPLAQEIVGIEGFAEILRENVKGTKMPVDKIVPDRDQIVQNTSKAKIQEFVMLLAQALQTDPQQIMQLVDQQRQNPTPQGKPREQDVAGNIPGGGMLRPAAGGGA